MMQKGTWLLHSEEPAAASRLAASSSSPSGLAGTSGWRPQWPGWAMQSMQKGSWTGTLCWALPETREPSPASGLRADGSVDAALRACMASVTPDALLLGLLPAPVLSCSPLPVPFGASAFVVPMLLAGWGLLGSGAREALTSGTLVASAVLLKTGVVCRAAEGAGFIWAVPGSLSFAGGAGSCMHAESSVCIAFELLLSVLVAEPFCLGTEGAGLSAAAPPPEESGAKPGGGSSHELFALWAVPCLGPAAAVTVGCLLLAVASLLASPGGVLSLDPS